MPKAGIAGPWNQSRVDQEPKAWTWVWTPGANLANFFALYDSRGDVTIGAPTSIATTLDGPIQVARYGALVVNAALTASQRCRGLMPIADSLSMGASGSISMTGMGASGSSKWAVTRDIFVPASITFTGKNTSLQQFLAWIRSTGYCIFDPSMYACPPPGMGDVTCDWATWTPYGSTIISGCGINPLSAVTEGAGNTVGANGQAGTNGPGAGGGGGASNGQRPRGGRAYPWGGGPGSGGSIIGGGGYVPHGDPTPGDYCGKGGDAYHSLLAAYCGGGAGTPKGVSIGNVAGNGGEGVGGILLCFIRGALNLTAGHSFSANGMPGGPSVSYGGGGGSGGGKCGVYYSGALTGSFNQTASGGAKGTGAVNGGDGGAGHAENKTFVVMGW